VLDQVVRHARRLMSASVTCIETVTGEDTLLVEACDGAGAESGVARVRPLAASPLYAELIAAAQAVTIAEAAPNHRAAWVGLAGLPVGPVLLVPLPGAPRPLGALSVGGAPGRLPFTPIEVELARLLAVHAALALEFRQRRGPRRAGSADRERIARDLHDVVMQRLFATGLRLQGLAPAVSAPVADTLTVAAASIDQTMADIRAAILALRQVETEAGSLRGALIAAAAQPTAAAPAGPG